MFNRERTKEVFGYDIDITKRRRTRAEIVAAPKVDKKSNLKVIDNCPECNKERIIKLRQSKKNKLCSKCFHNQEYVVKAKQNQNKEVSKETKQKMRDNHWSKTGVIESPFKAKKHTKQTKSILRKKRNQQFALYNDDKLKIMKEKASCNLRADSIPHKDFNGFVSSENTRIRQSAEGKAWRYDVMAKANFTCDKCGIRGGSLVAHHLNAFASYPDQRFNVNNGVCLCKECHNEFHVKYSKGNNTKGQYQEFKAPTVYLVSGVAASGKSWVCEQLLDKFDYISYDKTRKKDHVDLLLTPSDKPKLYDPTFKISTFIKRNSDKFHIIPVFIIETEEVIRERVKKRNGKFTEHMKKRIKEIEKRNIKYGTFAGTAQEVLDYLKRQ